MTSQNLTLTLNRSDVGPFGDIRSIPAQAITAPFTAMNSGIIDVPIGTTASVAFSIPFGSVGRGATGLVIQNETGKDLKIGFNGGTATHSLATGSVFGMAQPSITLVPLLSVALTTITTQTAAGTINYWVFGDPVSE